MSSTQKKNDPFPMGASLTFGYLTEHYEEESIIVDWEFNILNSIQNNKNWNAKSPIFSWSNTIWQLEATFIPGNELQLFLHKSISEDRLAVILKVGVRLPDGSSEMRSFFKKRFNKESCSWGPYEIIHQDELLKRKYELMSAGNITLSCSVIPEVMIQSKKRKYEDFDALSSDLMALFLSGKGSDMTIVVGEERYQVHKAILAARSEVLLATAQNNTEELNSDVIYVTEFKPKPFKDFLSYLYSGKVENFSQDNVYILYEISVKYNIKGLKKLCVDYIILNISMSNLFAIAILANQFKDIKLLSAAEKFFLSNSLEIIETEEWKNFVSENFSAANIFIRNTIKKRKTEE